MARGSRFLPLWLLIRTLLVVGLLCAGVGGSAGDARAVAQELSGETVALSSPSLALPHRTDVSERRAQEPLQKAKDLLSTIQGQQGHPSPGYIGGRTFHNRERQLPRGQYREYDVNPKMPGQPRGAERIVIEQRTGKAYYTPDHYRSFVPLN